MRREAVTRLSLSAMVAAGARAARRHARLLGALFLVELLASALYATGVALTLHARFGMRPLFGRGVAGDDSALLFALTAQWGAVSALVWVGIAWALGWAILSLYLDAGLLGVFAGRRFGETAGARFPAFLRLWLLALVPWAIGGAIVAAGVAIADLEIGDLASKRLFFGRTLGFAVPGLAVMAVVSCAVDYARARLVVGGGGGALRALGFGLRRALVRPAALLHLLLYLIVWVALTGLYASVTYGVAFAGAAGALALFGLRQLLCAARFVARAATSAGQVAALEVELVEPPRPPPEPPAA